MADDTDDGRSAWQQGWDAGYDDAKRGRLVATPCPFSVTDRRSLAWDAGYSQGDDDYYATTWLGGGA